LQIWWLNELSKLEYDDYTKIEKADDDCIEIYSRFKEKYYKSFIIQKEKFMDKVNSKHI